MTDQAAAGDESATTGRDPWMGVEIRHLEALAAIAREGSFRGASEALGYVQSAVSQQLAQLERLVGVRLMERSRGNGVVALTPAGELLLNHTEVILARYAEASAELRSLAEGRSGTLRVGVLQSVASRVVPQILLALGRRPGDVTLASVENADDLALLDELIDGTLDLAFCEQPLPAAPLEARALIEDPIVLLVPSGSALAVAGRPARAADLAGEPLVAFNSWRAQEEVRRWLEGHGVFSEPVYNSDHNTTVQGLVASGVGIALAPYLAVDPEHPGTAVIPLADGPPDRTVALAWHRERGLSPAGEAFVETAAAVCAAHAQTR